MANTEHLEILKQGVEVWNQWREENPEIRPDLSDSDVQAANLRGANLSGANLNKADFWRTNLDRTDLSGAFLIETNLREATLSLANLGFADFSGAKLRRAELGQAYLNWANLSGTELSEAKLIGAFLRRSYLNSTVLDGADLNLALMEGTTIVNADLSQTRGLKEVRHAGPSSIGIDTIYKSAGKIPEEFLRGAGVPEQFIAYARSLVEAPIAYYSVFISHSSKDEAFASRLHTDLQAEGIRAWYFPKDAKWGESVWGEIDRGVQHHDKLVLVCSENSLQSGPVLREIERALNREDKERKSVLFPIRIDDFVFEEWDHERKADVLRKVVGDFSDWETDADKYASSFARLLDGLQANE